VCIGNEPGDRREVDRDERGGKGMPDMANPTGDSGWGGSTEGGTGAGGAPDRNPSIREWPCVAFLSFSIPSEPEAKAAFAYASSSDGMLRLWPLPQKHPAEVNARTVPEIDDFRLMIDD
jgi:hypothetical protein